MPKITIIGPDGQRIEHGYPPDWSVDVELEAKLPEPQTYSLDEIKQTPGVWMPHSSYEPALRLVSQRDQPILVFYIGRPDVPVVAVGEWLSARFVPAPERLEDMRIVFGGGSGEEGAALATKIHHVLCHYSAIADSDIVELLQKCKKFIEAKCRL